MARPLRTWPKRQTMWIYGRVLYASIPFTWDLPEMRQYLRQKHAAWVRPTFEEARTCLVGYYTRKITDLARQLEYAERNLEAARKMEEPTP